MNKNVLRDRGDSKTTWRGDAAQRAEKRAQWRIGRRSKNEARCLFAEYFLCENATICPC